MSDGITIGRADTGDIETLTEFNMAMARETEDRDLDETTVKDGVRTLMEHPEYGFYLIARSENGSPVGTLMITYEWSDWRNGLFWWIQSVYVTEKFRRRGIYTAMHSRVREMALNNPEVCGLRLYVDEQNTIARTVYKSLEMQGTSYRIFEEEFSAG